nr:Chain A, PEPTIDE FRAGMENT [Homo sapiens]
TDHGAE